MAALALPVSSQAADAGSPIVLSTVTMDFNGDGLMDRAVLTRGDDKAGKADLTIELATPDGQLKRAIFKAGIMDVDDMSSPPELEIKKGRGDALLVESGQQSFGPRSIETLTIVYRHNAFLVAGYTTESWTASPDVQDDSQCDLDLITGRGVANGKPFSVSTKSPVLQNWPIKNPCDGRSPVTPLSSSN